MRKACHTGIIVLLMALGISLLPRQALAQPWAAWKAMAPAPEGEEEVYGAVAGGKVYLMGGIKPLWKPMGLVLEYDTQANKWAQKKPMPELKHHVGIAAVGDKIYLMGGFVYPAKGEPAWVPVATAWEYTPATDGWKKLASMPKPVGALACAGLGGKVYCAGGVRLPAWSKRSGLRPASEIEQPNDLLVYDPATNAWAAKAPMPSPRNHHVLLAVGGKLYAIGGRIGGPYVSGWSTPMAANEEYDPAADRWMPRSPMPTPRSAFGAVVVNEKIHVLGGEEWRQYSSTVHRTHEVYDPKANRWTASVPLATPRHGFLAAAVGNRLYAISGANVSGGSGPHLGLKVNEMLEVK